MLGQTNQSGARRLYQCPMHFILADFNDCICISMPITQAALKCRGINTSRRSSSQSIILWHLCIYFPVPCPLGGVILTYVFPCRFNPQLYTIMAG